MYQAAVSYSMFVDAFKRLNRYNQFASHYCDGIPVGAYDAMRILYDHLEDGYENTELDVIAICLSYSHDTWSEIADQYGLVCINTRDMTEDECRDAVRDYLVDRGAYGRGRVWRIVNGYLDMNCPIADFDRWANSLEHRMVLPTCEEDFVNTVKWIGGK